MIWDKYKFSTYFLKVQILVCITVFTGCDRGSSVANNPPDTKLAIDAINLSGPNRLNSIVQMSWYGTDRDGYVVGYDISTDTNVYDTGNGPQIFYDWQKTTKQDSTFYFSIPEGQDTADIYLSVRSRDNEGAVDPTPASLIIPLKNSVPNLEIDQSTQSLGSQIGVLTYRWNGSDPDGDETIQSAEFRFNDGSWAELDPNENQITFVLNENLSNPFQAELYYGNDSEPEYSGVTGIKIDSANILQIRVTDIAGATSIPDSALPVILTKPNSNILLISGQTSSITNSYKSWLTSIPVNYDLIDFEENNGESRPYYWNPTFRHILNQYSKVITVTNSDNILDPLTGITQPLLAHMALSMQQYINSGGKIINTTSFGPSTDLTPYIGTFPISGVVSSTGQVRLVTDSSIVSQVGSNYPNLSPSSILIGISPVTPSADAEIFYRAQLTKLSGWQGDNVVGVRRKYLGNPNKINEVFFSLELHKVAANNSAISNLLEQILVYDFDW